MVLSRATLYVVFTICCSVLFHHTANAANVKVELWQRLDHQLNPSHAREYQRQKFYTLEVAHRFDRTFRDLLTAYNVPGGAYVITYGNDIVAMQAVGVRDKKTREPLTTHTVFRLASLSKSFAASLTALLVDQGQLSWQTHVTDYVPQLRFKEQRYSDALTIKHLLSQSSGLMPNAFDNILEANIPPQQMFDNFATLQPFCPPGQCYSYQNVLFAFIEPVLEAITQQPYEMALQQRVLQPLGMHDASVGMDAFLATSDRATPHLKTAYGWIAGHVTPEYYQVPSAAGVNASISDMGQWLIAQQGYYPRVLSPQSLQQLSTPKVHSKRETHRAVWHNFMNDAHYGLGWRIYQLDNDETLIYHSGWVKGFVGDMSYSKQHRVGIAVLLNAESRVISQLSASFWRDYLQLDAS
ncbi:serine hydrolase domain-containing protein [Idiomarina xiamenensis]|uniref:Beta-lactamase n=1 Tax=Idiomarina xiamenensis 10-D-4 TaxID=740709 RepID=K2K1E7_9GAMM|nr:serine hydrolase domain-containing protein [Idiomarina xiamenensis]EKE81538.1 beta-lactamase [Idiomarina xiamenensis 10-D-4]